MSTVAIITDTHFGARNDSLHMVTNMQKFYEKVFFPTLDAHNVTQVLHGGDYVDRRKYINFQTAHLIEQVYRGQLRRRNIHETVIVGNHDIFFRQTTELNAPAQLYRDDPSMSVHIQPVEIDVDGCGMLLLPWITDNNKHASMMLLEQSSCSVVLGHLEVAGFQMFRGMPSLSGMDASVFERFGLVMSGHFHHRSSNGPIQYLGAPYPMIWSDYRDPRGFHLFNTDTKELTFIENPYSLFMRIVYDDAGKTHDYIKALGRDIMAKDSPYRDAYVKVVVRTKTQPYWFELMMDSLYKVNAQDIIVQDDIIVNDEGDESEVPMVDVDTLTLMKEYVDTLTISCDKDELMAYLQSKYHEAVTASQSARL